MGKHPQVTVSVQARENSEYLHALLREKQPEFLAILELAEGLTDFELSRESQARRALMNVPDDLPPDLSPPPHELRSPA
jgi:hypothetical protein